MVASAHSVALYSTLNMQFQNGYTIKTIDYPCMYDISSATRYAQQKQSFKWQVCVFCLHHCLQCYEENNIHSVKLYAIHRYIT